MSFFYFFFWYAYFKWKKRTKRRCKRFQNISFLDKHVNDGQDFLLQTEIGFHFSQGVRVSGPNKYIKLRLYIITI